MTRTKEAPKPEERVYQRRSLVSTREATRFAKGPDGTKGFAAGRGKPIAAGAGGAVAID